MDFTPSIALSAEETLRLRRLAERCCGERYTGKFMREVASSLRRAAKGRRVKVVDFTTPADRAAFRLQVGVVVDGRPDHGMIFGLTGARQGASPDN